MKSVFISSTQRDLSEYRDTVKAAIERLDLRAIDMRNFGSQPGGAVGVSVREVRKGDIYVGILAQRYGYVPDGMIKSVTEQEYDEAVRLHLPRLMYLLDDKFPWESARIETEPTAQARLQAFKDRVNANEVRSLFTTPDDLAKQVTADLVKLLDKGRRQAMITRGLAAALTVIVLSALVLIADTGIRDQALKIVGIASPTPTATATSTSTLTPTITPSPTDTPTPTTTPIEGTPFASDVIGVVLADFKNDEMGVNSLGDPLALAFQQQNIPYIRVHHVLADRLEAQQLAKLYSATLVVWGEKFSTGVQINYEVEPTHSQIDTTVSDLLVAVDDHFSNFVIDQGMGIPYLLDFTLGQMLYFENNYDAALAALDKAIKIIPPGQDIKLQAASLFNYHGLVNDKLGQEQEALADFNHALEIDPKNASAYNNRGVAYSKQGNYNDAVTNYTTAIRLNPAYVNAYFNRAVAYGDQGKIDDALADYTSALNHNPHTDKQIAVIYFNRGTLYIGQGNKEAALADFTSAIDHDSTLATAYYNRGLTYIELGKLDEALTDFTSAIDHDPANADAYYNRGLTYKNQGKLDEALADFTSAIDHDPNDVAAYISRGLIYAQQGNDDAALADYNSAIERAPDDTAAYNARGAFYYRQGKLSAALADYNRAIDLNPDFLIAYFNRALVYRDQGQDEAARTDLTRYLDQVPDDADSYGARGGANYHLGNFPEAIADYHSYYALTGKLEPFMQQQITEMKATLAETPEVAATLAS